MSASSTSANLYRISVLATASARMWRAWRIVLPVVLVNALLQAGLLIPGVLPYLSIPFAFASLLSFVILALAFGVVAAGMLQAAEGPVDARFAWSALRARWLPLLAWSFGLVVVVTIGFSLYVLPGFAILAATPYVLIAVVDGKRQPLRVNFRTIPARWGRWLITILALAVLCLILWVLTLVDAFFVGGPGGAFVAWIVLGLIASWFVCAWAVLYRSINPRGEGQLD